MWKWIWGWWSCTCSKNSGRGGAHRKSTQHTISPFPATPRDNRHRRGRDKGTCERKRKKKSFLWFIYDAVKVCWMHQNMQQWSYCQGRWSVFIVDWANERGKESEGKLDGERGGWLYCRRVLTISSLPHHHTRHKMATSFLLTAGTRRGAIWTIAISSPTSAAYSSTPTISLIYWLVSYNTLLSEFLPAHFYTKWNLLNQSYCRAQLFW